MIDSLSKLSRKFVWLRPLLLIVSFIAFIVFGWVVLFTTGAEKDIYIIPCIVSMLWSISFWLLLSIFPHVPQRTDSKDKLYKRFKIATIRAAYHFVALIFLLLSILTIFLSLKLFNVWRRDFL